LSRNDHPRTLDGRYFVVRGRLWRTSDPKLGDIERARHVSDLMTARRAVQKALAGEDADALKRARAEVQSAKVALGERGPVWWTDGTPDLNRHMAKNTPYAAWYAGLDVE